MENKVYHIAVDNDEFYIVINNEVFTATEEELDTLNKFGVEYKLFNDIESAYKYLRGTQFFISANDGKKNTRI